MDLFNYTDLATTQDWVRWVLGPALLHLAVAIIGNRIIRLVGEHPMHAERRSSPEVERPAWVTLAGSLAKVLLITVVSATLWLPLQTVYVAYLFLLMLLLAVLHEVVKRRRGFTED